MPVNSKTTEPVSCACELCCIDVGCVQVLDNLKEKFMQKDGDFLSFPSNAGLERKTDDQVLARYWPYINGWIAMAAQRLGR